MPTLRFPDLTCAKKFQDEAVWQLAISARRHRRRCRLDRLSGRRQRNPVDEGTERPALEVECPGQERSHLPSGHRLVRAEPVIDRRVAAQRHSSRTQLVDIRLKDRIVVVDK